jgi:hypothetical protein
MKKSILVFRSAALGDFILCTPALKSLRDRFPNHDIKFITISTTNVDQSKIVSMYSGGHAKAPWLTLITPHLIADSFVFGRINISNFLKCKKWLKRSDIDFAVLMLDPYAPYWGRFKKIFLLKLLCNFKKIYGWKGWGSINGDKSSLLRFGLIKHHIFGPFQFLSEIESVGTDTVPIEFDLRPTMGSIYWAQELIRLYGRSYLKIAIFPGALHGHKKWPTDRYISIINRLKSEYKNVLFVVFGTKNDHDFSQSLNLCVDVEFIDLIGKTSIDQSAALLSLMNLVIGNDGGGIHLAAAMGCKVVSIIPGIEYPGAIDPWGNQKYSVRHFVDCAPCYSFTYCPNGTMKCMHDIPVDSVFQMCKKALNEHKERI